MLRRTFISTAILVGAAPLAAQVTSATQPDAASVAVEKLATLLEEGYVVPTTGRRYAAMLRTKLASGGYRAFASPAALGAQLTLDLRALSDDRHLRVVPDQSRPVGGPGQRVGPPRAPALQDAGWLAPGVAYLRYTGFTGEPDTVAATQAFMRAHAGARALIIDSRYNGGGGLDEMDVILPYLFATETPLVRFEMVEAIAKARGLPFVAPSVRPVDLRDGVVRTVHYATPRPDERRWRDAEVFYLTSPRTGSAAEHLALAFKHTGRATLIGGTTAGANHFGDDEPIGWGLAVFLPVGRTVDLTTGADWEGTGIAPDIAVPPVNALSEALRRAGVTLPA